MTQDIPSPKAAPKSRQTLFQKMIKGSDDRNSQAYFHVPLQQMALTIKTVDWTPTDFEKKIQHYGVLFEYLHRRFGKEAEPLNTVLLSQDLIAWLLEPAEEKYPLPLTNFLWLIAHYVEPFNRLYDIKTKRGIEGLYRSMAAEYYIGMNLPAILLPDAVFDYLAQDYPCAHAPAAPVMPLSRGLAHIWREYIPEVPFTPDDALARTKFFMRFLVFAQMTEIDLRLFNPALVHYLNTPLFETDMQGVHATGLIYEVLHMAGMGNIVEWQNKTYVSEMTRRFFGGAFSAMMLPAAIMDPHAVLAARCGVSKHIPKYLTGGTRAQKKYIMQDEQALPQDHNKAWVNIIETGDGLTPFNAMTRQIHLAIKEARVPATTILPPYAPYKDYIKSQQLENMPWGGINLFAVDLKKCADVMLSQGLATMNGRINIGYCTWETNLLPLSYRVGAELLDEIWVPTEYVKKVFAAATATPVYVMPYPVTLCKPCAHLGRQLYDLPDDVFVFITALDCFDLMARKNPVAAARAFQQAFPDNPKVRLLIKIGNLDKANVPKEFSSLEKIQEYSRRDPRIILVHQNFSDEEMSAFMNMADCYISLHRHSAYGRAIMEAMLLGKPVILTKGSGPADYATEKTAALVECVECSVVYDAYEYLDRERGHRWHDPELSHAATLMQRMVEDSAYAQSLARAGQHHIATHYHPEVIGKKMRDRIETIMKSNYGSAV
ncbi:MAG: glycosyltransferase family 1 protein [Alphaproteobacteria bacterium]|nr:glycosyltransferase family 1 protein [Alphaproteobacteria bacterium]